MKSGPHPRFALFLFLVAPLATSPALTDAGRATAQMFMPPYGYPMRPPPVFIPRPPLYGPRDDMDVMGPDEPAELGYPEDHYRRSLGRRERPRRPKSPPPSDAQASQARKQARRPPSRLAPLGGMAIPQPAPAAGQDARPPIAAKEITAPSAPAPAKSPATQAEASAPAIPAGAIRNEPNRKSNLDK